MAPVAEEGDRGSVGAVAGEGLLLTGWKREDLLAAGWKAGAAVFGLLLEGLIRVMASWPVMVKEKSEGLLWLVWRWGWLWGWRFQPCVGKGRLEVSRPGKRGAEAGLCLCWPGEGRSGEGLYCGRVCVAGWRGKKKTKVPGLVCLAGEQGRRAGRWRLEDKRSDGQGGAGSGFFFAEGKWAATWVWGLKVLWFLGFFCGSGFLCDSL